MSTEEQRARFEAWHRDKFKTRNCTGQPTRDMHNGVHDDHYGPKHQQEMWEAWQAAIGGVCVELPETGDPEFPDFAGGFKFGVDTCRDAIHAAGVKTK